jgi:formylmethanofuran dehydrogenase subunit B
MPVHVDQACSLCGCVCDDLLFEVQGDRIRRVEKACLRAEQVFTKLGLPGPPVAAIQGQVCELEDALAAAAELLHHSRLPVFAGLGNSATPGQRAAIQLAERIGGVIDGGSPLGRAALRAMQQVGLSTCTLGELRQRADLIVIWDADPATTHPRLLERIAGEFVTEFLPQGRADRTIIVLSEQPTASDAAADVSWRISADSHDQLICGLRLAIRDDAAKVSDCGGLTGAQIRDLAQRLKACRYGTILFGAGFAQGPAAAETVAALYRLVAELNASTRFTARALTQPGADNVLAWQTGFAQAVDFRRGHPRSLPGEFSAAEMIARGEADCCVILGTDALTDWPAEAQTKLNELPTIVLNPAWQTPPFIARVQFTTATYGWDAEGTVYRLDEVAIPARAICESRSPRDADVLRQLLERFPPNA